MMAATTRVALLQLAAFSIEDAEASLAHTLERIDDAASRRPDIIALPEVTYPAYFIGDAPPPTRPPSEIVEIFAAKARQHGLHIAAGIAMDTAQGLVNGAALFGRDGALIGTYAKSFLWHFDTRWFTAGSTYPVFETDCGRIGMLVCADGRMPEIARCLTLNGAQIILDLTAWVSSGRRPEDLTTTQVTHLMPVRAAENGVWIACADKFGIEAQTLLYAGRSCVIDPHGQTVAALGPGEEGTLVYDIPVEDAALRVERRPELYRTLQHPTESLPVAREIGESLVPRDEERRIGCVQMTFPATPDEFLALARAHARRMALLDAHVVLFPATPSRLRALYAHDQILRGMIENARDAGICLAFTVSEGDLGSGRRVMYLVGPRGVISQHFQTHKPSGARFESMPLGDEVCPVVSTPLGRVGLMLAAEGFVPEVARSLMLRGAEMILWAADDPPLAMTPFVRARAEENRVFVASAAAASANGATAVVDPDGRVLATALEGHELAVTAGVNRMFSHIKTRAPGTDVVLNRQPATYAAITSPAGQPVAGSVLS